MRLFVTLLLTSVLLGSVASAPRGQAQTGATARDQKVAAATEALRARLVETRRDFHMHPELSNREERTARVVAERLRALGLTDVKTGVGQSRRDRAPRRREARPRRRGARRHGRAAHPGDVDGRPYKSQTPGVMHACGHDVHTTVELGVAEVLSKMKDEVRGTVKFIFQPAEEGAPAGEEGGAKLMIKEGALENPRPQAIFGLHTEPNLQAGQIGYHSGPAMASSDTFYITVQRQVLARRAAARTAWTRSSSPRSASSRCRTSAAAASTRWSRSSSPSGRFRAAQRFNVIAGEVKMTGTMRTLQRRGARALNRLDARDAPERDGRLRRDLRAERLSDSNPVTYNEPALVEETLPTIRRVVGDGNALAIKPFMPAEDFSAYQKVVPGFYYFLGVGNRARASPPAGTRPTSTWTRRASSSASRSCRTSCSTTSNGTRGIRSRQ